MDTAATQHGHDQAREEAHDQAQGAAHGREGGQGHPRDHELTVTIPLDRAVEMVGEPLAVAGRMLSSRGGLPVYVGLGVMAAADVIAWPVAAAAGLGYAVLRWWGPLRPPVPPGGRQVERGAGDLP